MQFGVPLDTFAQSGTNQHKTKGELICRKGSDITNNKVLQGKAKRKLVTQVMMLKLIDIAKENNDQENVKRYWNAYHCQTKIYEHKGLTYGNYCKNRFCTLCCSIRKAEIINKYLPIINTCEQPYFVTLTIKASSKRLLKSRIEGIYKAFKRIKDKCRKQHQRGKGN